MQIIYYLRARGYVCGKTKTVGIMRNGRFTYDPYLFRGFADITAFVPHIVFIEVKSARGRQTLEQKSFQECCEKAGIPYILARHLEDVSDVIK